MGQANYNGALQKPIGSGFNAKSTSTEVIKGIDLIGKIAIVTGASTGIGLETVKTLANAGATVILPARNIEKAEENLQGIDNVEIEKMDLLDHHSIDTFAEKFLASGRPLHLLINNAGIMWVPLRRDHRGIESQLAVNYLAQFQLTAKLWKALKEANGARVINVSSQGHQFAPFNFDDPNFEHREYETLQGYGQSKTAVNLFSLELDNRSTKPPRLSAIAFTSATAASTTSTSMATEAKEITFLSKLSSVDAPEKPSPTISLDRDLVTLGSGSGTAGAAHSVESSKRTPPSAFDSVSGKDRGPL